MSVLLVAAVTFPAALVVCWPWRKLRSLGMALAPWAAAPALALAVSQLVFPATEPAVDIPLLLSGIRLGVDGVGGAFLLLTALLWLVGGVFARSYHARDPRRESFFGYAPLPGIFPGGAGSIPL